MLSALAAHVVTLSKKVGYIGGGRDVETIEGKVTLTQIKARANTLLA
jgi:hypothetical protein